MITQDGVIALAAGMMFFGGLTAFLFARFFCSRPAPPWLHWWRDLSIAFIGARLIGASVFELPLDWFGTLLWLNLGLAQIAIGLYRWRHAIGARGDRCRNESAPAT